MIAVGESLFSSSESQFACRRGNYGYGEGEGEGEGKGGHTPISDRGH